MVLGNMQRGGMRGRGAGRGSRGGNRDEIHSVVLCLVTWLGSREGRFDVMLQIFVCCGPQFYMWYLFHINFQTILT